MGHGQGVPEVDEVLRLRSTVPRRRGVRARLGGLEDVLFAARAFRGRVAATPRLKRGYSEVAATPRLKRGYSEGRYLGRPETDEVRCLAMWGLGKASCGKNPEEALPILEATLALRQRCFSFDLNSILVTQTSLALCLSDLGRRDEALVLEREIYARQVATLGRSHEDTLLTANNLCASLIDCGEFDESRTFARKNLSAANTALGRDSESALFACVRLSHALFKHPAASRDYPR